LHILEGGRGGDEGIFMVRIQNKTRQDRKVLGMKTNNRERKLAAISMHKKWKHNTTKQSTIEHKTKQDKTRQDKTTRQCKRGDAKMKMKKKIGKLKKNFFFF
jgi:hypothetical protein